MVGFFYLKLKIFIYKSTVKILGFGGKFYLLPRITTGVKKQQIPFPTVGMWGKSKLLIIKNKKEGIFSVLIIF